MRASVIAVVFVTAIALLGWSGKGWSGPANPPQNIDETIPEGSSSYTKYHRPHAQWLTADHQVGDNVGPLYEYLVLSEKQHRRPEVVIYFIPERDLGESSEGGFATFDQYLAENRLLAGVIGKFSQHNPQRKPRVYLEPDALGHAISFQRERNYDPRSVQTYQARTRTLRQLVTLYRQAGAMVYLDIAHGEWMRNPDDVRLMAETLKLSGADQADGLVTNISNRQPATMPPGKVMARTEWDYLQELTAQLPKKSWDLVIDTSRNGGTTRPRLYYLAGNGQLYDNQPAGQGAPVRLVGMWRQEQGETWFHPFYGNVKPLSRLLKKEKYTFDAGHKVLSAPAWLDPIGDVQLGPAPVDGPSQIAAPSPLRVKFRDIKPPDDCDGSLNCPPGQSKSWIIGQTQRLQPAAAQLPKISW